MSEPARKLFKSFRSLYRALVKNTHIVWLQWHFSTIGHSRRDHWRSSNGIGTERENKMSKPIVQTLVQMVRSHVSGWFESAGLDQIVEGPFSLKSTHVLLDKIKTFREQTLELIRKLKLEVGEIFREVVEQKCDIGKHSTHQSINYEKLNRLYIFLVHLQIKTKIFKKRNYHRRSLLLTSMMNFSQIIRILPDSNCVNFLT